MANGGLSRLRSGLTMLQRRRAAVRWGTAACAVVSAAGIFWGAAFLIDWSLRLPWEFRAALLCGGCAGMVWGVWNIAWSALAVRETPEELALQVERRHGIDSDLIAALQFESSGDAVWGSRQLSSAVVASVEKLAPQVNVMEGFSWGSLPRRMVTALALILVLVLAATAYPGEFSAFWNRFWLGSARYPSRTQIMQFHLNGRSLPAVADRRQAVGLPQGTTLSLEVICDGEQPASGSARLIDRNQRIETEFILKPAIDGPAGRLIGEHPLPSSDVELQIAVGDAWIDPVPIRIMRLPLVEVTWHVKPPAYAAAQSAEETFAGARQISVLAGSAVELSVRGLNKELAGVSLRLDEESIPLVRVDDGAKKAWQLPTGSPLSHVIQPWRYEIHAIDQDGLELTPPISGNLRLTVDHPPRVTAEIVTRLVVPTARPRLAYHAADDYGLSQVRVHFAVKRGTNELRSSTQLLQEVSESSPLAAVLRGEYALDLSPLQLEPGDELRVTVEAADVRGEMPGEAGMSEPVVLKVTDRAGVIAGLLEADQATVERLDRIIQRELGSPGEDQ